MGFIGNPPLQDGIGLFSQDTFTGDGSTTTFDLTNAVPDGGDNDIQVFVDNVRQQAGSSNAYTVGFDGSSVFKRITFTSAPASGQTIFVLNPGTKNAQVIQSISDNTVTTAKVQDNAVTVAKLASTLDLSSNTVTLPNDVVNADKIVDNAISGEHLDPTVVSDLTSLGEGAASNDTIIIFDTSSSTLKKVTQNNFLSLPVVSSVSPTSVVSGDGTGNHTFTITGTGFTGGSAALINNSGSTVNFDTVTVDSATQITGVIAKSSLPNSGEPYDVRVTAASGLRSTLENQINIDASPTFNTASGSLGTVVDGARATATFDIEAFDPESAGNVSFEIQSGSLPPGATTSTVNENGVSKFRIAGTFTAVGSNTTSTFVVRAVDAASNTTSRSFSLTVAAPQSDSFTSSGTFSVPTGLTSADVLVVAGGGGSGGDNAGGAGGGGLIYFPSYPLTPGGTVTVTVGDGGTGNAGDSATNGQDSVFGSPGNPGLGQGGVLTAKGGGSSRGNTTAVGRPGGSGGGANGHNPNVAGGQGIQPTQPGNSGSYGFGNPAGNTAPSPRRGGGGGGAGGAGENAPNGAAGAGGVGKSYTIADGTTSVAYAGGGGGASNVCGNPGPGSPCGTGGAGGHPGGANGDGVSGQANRGGGGGGAMNANPRLGGSGGKGIVIIRY